MWVFTFGIGDGASTRLIKNVAKASNGKAIFIKDKDNMQAKVITAMKGSLDNCLSEVSLHWDIPKCFTITDIPKEPPVVFHGDKLVLFALLKSSDAESGISGFFTLKGRIEEKNISHKVKIEIPSSSHNDLPLHRVAAKYQIKDLENDDDLSYRGHGRNKDKIVLVSQAANIISKYTAFVGVDKDSKVPLSVLKEPRRMPRLCSSSFDEEMLEKSQLKVANVHSMPLDVSCYKLTQKEVLGLVPLGISRKKMTYSGKTDREEDTQMD
ncbi:von Willebrand factor A domain-containing protein 5A-like [Mytilus trossulus]|uniref:von Willebrand factor A domain-containing protein 5A-like n=1 Tax=Mytilus trossulus TaxID=6551 RepID=UPI0030075014